MWPCLLRLTPPHSGVLLTDKMFHFGPYLVEMGPLIKARNVMMAIIRLAMVVQSFAAMKARILGCAVEMAALVLLLPNVTRERRAPLGVVLTWARIVMMEICSTGMVVQRSA